MIDYLIAFCILVVCIVCCKWAIEEIKHPDIDDPYWHKDR